MQKTIFSFAMALVSSVSLAQSDLDLSEMSESDKNKTGLYKLSESEIKSLESWLNNQHKSIVKEQKTKNAGFEQKQITNRDTVNTTLEKMYQDKLGNTYYKLNNGQVWKQIQSGRVNISKNATTPITIEPKFMGSWMLKGEGNRGVKVKRIR